MSGDIRVVRGEPTDEELAALVAVLAALAAQVEAAEVLHPKRGWGDPARVLHLPARPGATPWRGAEAA